MGGQTAYEHLQDNVGWHEGAREKLNNMNCCADFSQPFGSDGDLQDAFVCVLLFYKSLLMDVAFSHEFQLLRVTLYSISHISKTSLPKILTGTS